MKHKTVNKGNNNIKIKKLEPYLKTNEQTKIITYTHFHKNKSPVPCQSECLGTTLKQNNPSKQARRHCPLKNSE